VVILFAVMLYVSGDVCQEMADCVKINDNVFHKNSNYLTFIRVNPYRWVHIPKNKTCIIK